MLTDLPKIYPITDEAISGLPHVEQVTRLAAAGARLIQFRDKVSSGREFYRSALASLGAARAGGAKLIINDRVDIALAIGADGVHLGQDDLPPKHARAILGDDAIVGFSTHTLEQALAAASLPIDYIAIGPVFPTSSKSNPDAVVGVETLKRIRATLPDVRVVAIGGIDDTNAADAFAAGAGAVAIISYLLSEPAEIAHRFHRLDAVASRA